MLFDENPRDPSEGEGVPTNDPSPEPGAPTAAVADSLTLTTLCDSRNWRKRVVALDSGGIEVSVWSPLGERHAIIVADTKADACRQVLDTLVTTGRVTRAEVDDARAVALAA